MRNALVCEPEGTRDASRDGLGQLRRQRVADLAIRLRFRSGKMLTVRKPLQASDHFDGQPRHTDEPWFRGMISQARAFDAERGPSLA
jgi:hypothetical protein